MAKSWLEREERRNAEGRVEVSAKSERGVSMKSKIGPEEWTSVAVESEIDVLAEAAVVLTVTSGGVVLGSGRVGRVAVSGREFVGDDGSVALTHRIMLLSWYELM